MEKNYKSVGNPLDEEKLHISLAKEINNGLVVQIGALIGYTSSLYLDNNSNLELIDIDPIIPDSMNPNLIGSIDILRNLEKKHKNYTFIHDYSFNVVKKFDKKISVLFIDGSHHYNDVKEDFENYLPFVKQNGYIALHDSAMFRDGPNFHEGSSIFTDEILYDNRLEYIKTIFSLTLFTKK